MSRLAVLLALTLIVALLAAPLAAGAQPARKVYRVGLLYPGLRPSLTLHDRALRDGLHALGCVVGQNLVIDYRLADDRWDRLPTVAAELAAAKVDVILTVGTAGHRDVRTTMIYTHVLNRGPARVRSPADRVLAP